LEDLHILDLLELAGSQYKAGAALAVHQSTVSRSLRLMQQQFRLVSGEGPAICRYGHNSCLQYLRLAYREHRLMEGLLRIGTDPLHQGFLDGMAIVQQVPAQFRSSEQWVELVRLGLLDGAIVSSFSLERSFPSDGRPTWDGLAVLPLGQLGLQLVATAPETQGVLLPRKLATPQLHQAIEGQGPAVEHQPAACQKPDAWLKRARDRQLAIPVCSDLVGANWLAAHNLAHLEQQPELHEQMSLLLHNATAQSRVAQITRRLLRYQAGMVTGLKDCFRFWLCWSCRWSNPFQFSLPPVWQGWPW
jgi:hypothetical protein